MEWKSGFIFTAVVLFTVLAVASLVSAPESDAVLHFQYSEIDFDWACSYYNVENTKPLGLSSKETLQSLSLKSVNNVIGSISNGVWEYQYTELYTYPVRTCNEVCNPYDSMNLTRVDNCEVVCTTKEVEGSRLSWIAKSDAALDSKVQLDPGSYAPARFCADIQRESTATGWRILADHIPELDSVVYDKYAWWDSNWDYRRALDITPQDETKNYENYFMNVSVDLLSLHNAGKLETDWADLRITTDSDVSIDYKVVQPRDGSNATVWFNFTNTSAATTRYWMYYGYSSAVQPDDHNFTNWAHAGWDFDRETNGTAPGFFDTCTNCFIVDDYWYSGTPSGNKSVQIGGANHIIQDQMGAIQQGKWEFSLNVTEVGSGEIFGEILIALLDTGSSKYVARFEVDDAGATETNFYYYDGAAYTIWFNMTEKEEYFFVVDLDVPGGKWNVTVHNSTWSATKNNLAIGTAGATDASYLYLKTYQATANVKFDDFLLRNTSGVYKEPLSSIGAEDTEALPGEAAPQYSLNFTDPVTPQVYTGSRKYGFQITWVEEVDNVTFESDFNGTLGNYSYSSGHIKNITESVFWINFTDSNVTVAPHNYTWYAYNITNGNKTEQIGYTTTAAVGTSIDMWINGTLNADHAETWPSDVNTTCKINRATENTIVMERNGTAVGSQVGQVSKINDDLDGGIYNFTCYYTEANYTAFVREQTFTLNPMPTTVELYMNGSGSSQTLFNGTYINLTATSDLTGYLISIDTNITGWETQSDTTTISNVSIWNVTPVPQTFNITGFMNGDNFTDSYETWYLTLDDVEVDAESYEDDILESSIQIITATFGFPVGAEDLYATLIWNNSVYSNDTVFMNSTHIRLGATVTVPNIAEETEDVTFFWNYSYNAHEHLNRTSTVRSQQVHTPKISHCNNTYNSSSVDIYFYDENSTSFTVVNVTAELYLEFPVGDSIYSYNTSFNNESINLCIFPAWSNFTVDGGLTYTNDSYVYRIYTFDNEVFDNDTRTLDMLLIDAASAPKITKINVKDEYSNAYPGVVVKAQRWYASLGLYKTAAAPVTDESGNAYTYLELDDAEYRFLLYSNGVLLKTVPKRMIPNVAAEDPIYLEFMVTFDEIVEWLIFKDKITGTCSYANSTGNLTCSYYDESSPIRLSEVRLSITKYQGALESSTYYSGTNTSVPSGSFVVWLDNSTVYTAAYSYTMTALLNINENEWFVVHSGILEEGASVSLLFGDCKDPANLIKCREGAIIAFFMTITAAMVGVSISPAVSFLMLLFTLGVVSAVGLWAISAQTLIGMVLVAGIMIYRMRGR